MDFWARRRAGVEAEAKAEEAAQQALREDEARQALAEKSDEDLLVELGLPDPDGLKLGDDIRGFMSRTVPERLRQRALRQLWRLNPVLANVDGLVDYGGDYTDSATVMENMQTTYQVGKGMLRHVEEMARQAEALADAAGVPPKDATVDTVTSLHEPSGAPEAPVPVEWETVVQTPTEDPGTDDTEAAPPRPRRMQFTFSPETA